MKKTTLTDDPPRDFQTFFDEEFLAANPLSVRENAALPAHNSVSKNDTLLDNSLAAVKWLFLYLPGAAAIHFVLMGLALAAFYGDWFIELFLGLLGIFSVAAFMIMFGLGKLSDLKYLKVVLGVFLTSALAAIFYSLLIVFMPGDFFGFFLKLTLPLPVLAGFLIKKMIDKEKTGDEEC